MVTPVHAAGADLGGGAENACQSDFTDRVKEAVSCSTPQKEVLIIPFESSTVCLSKAAAATLSSTVVSEAENGSSCVLCPLPPPDSKRNLRPPPQ